MGPLCQTHNPIPPITTLDPLDCRLYSDSTRRCCYETQIVCVNHVTRTTDCWCTLTVRVVVVTRHTNRMCQSHNPTHGLPLSSDSTRRCCYETQQSYVSITYPYP